MSRPLRIAGYIAIGIVSGLLVATVAIWLLTRTDWGMERARLFAVSWLDERVNGELRVGRISGGGLLGGVIIHDFGIVDPDGRPFLSTDSLELSYNWRTLAAGRIVLDRVVMHRPSIVLEQLPGDTAWNYEHIFAGQTPGPATAERSLIMFNDARILNGTAVVRMPLDIDAIDAPADTARLIIERVPGGLARVMRFENIDARLDRVIWESPIEKGRLFNIRSVQARGFVYRDPFQIRDARGTLTMRDSMVAFDMPEVVLPSSSASILGTVIVQERNDMDIRIAGDRLRFRDLQWLYPTLPDEGGGSLVLRIRTQPDGTLFLAEDARLATPGTNVAGTFGVVVGDSMYFTAVNLRASPLDVRLLEQLLPGGLPVDGLLVGTVEISGPLSSLQTSGDMRLAGPSAGAGSALSWRGVLDVRNGQVSARSLSANVSRLDLALLGAFNPDIQWTGSVSGNVQGSGRLDRLRFTAAVEHASADGGRSRFDGGGTIEGSGRSRRYELTVNAAPTTLQDLSTYVPALRGMQGELRGPVRLDGTLDDVAVEALLETAGGVLDIDARLHRLDGGHQVTGSARMNGFRLHALWPALPATVLSGSVAFDLAGTSLATVDGAVELLLDSLAVGTLPNSTVALFGTVRDGLLSVDSSLLRNVLGAGRARGTVALLPDREGRLEADFSSASLAPLERIDGSVEGRAELTGAPGRYTVTAHAAGTGIVYGALGAARLRADAEVTGLTGDAVSISIAASADSATAWQHALQTAQFEAAGRPDSLAVVVYTGQDGEARFRARADVGRSDAGMAVSVHELRVGGASPWRLTAPVLVTVAGGVASLDSLELRHAAGGVATAAGRLAWAGRADGAVPPLDFRMRLSGVPFTELLRAVRSAQDGAGTMEGTVRVAGTALEPLIEADVSARDVRYGDVRIDRAFAELSYAALGLDAFAEAQYDGRSIMTGGGRIPLDLRLTTVAERRRDAPLRVTISADSLPPALPLGLLNGFTNVSGRIDGGIALAGTTLEPSLAGGFTLSGATADWDVSGVRYRDVHGTFTLEQDRLLRLDVAASAADPRARGGAGGAGTVTGTLDFAQLSDPAFDLSFHAERAYAARRRDVEATVTGAAHLGGRYTRPEVSGALRVDEGALYIDELYRQYLIVGLELDDPSLLSMVDTSLVAVRPLLAVSTNPFLRGLHVRNLQLAVGADSWLRSRDMDVEVTGNLTVAFDRLDEDLRLSGSLDVQRGTYTLYYPPLQSRRFQVREGSIVFPGTPGIDPNLSITAAYRARAQGEPLDVLAVVSGSLQGPRVRLSSDSQPPISESDLASYLFFGVPTWEVANSGAGVADMRAMAGLGFRALGPSVLGFASSGLQTLVQNAGLLDYVSLTAADVATADQQATGITRVLAGTQLELGRYLSSDLFLGYTQRLAAGSYAPAVRLEWRFMPEYSFEMFAEDRLARMPAFGLRTDTGLLKVYGFSLFREWGY